MGFWIHSYIQVRITYVRSHMIKRIKNIKKVVEILNYNRNMKIIQNKIKTKFKLLNSIKEIITLAYNLNDI